MNILINYSIRLIPGLIILTGTYFLLHTKEKLLRLFVLILGFILMRDTMTPMGIWNFGVTEGIVWLRFIENNFILITLALTSLVLSLIILRFHALNHRSINWFGTSDPVRSISMGLMGSVIAASPFLLPYFFTDINNRGGSVSTNILIALLIFTLLGNFLEEVLFRELLQQELRQRMGLKRSIILSALFFALGHIFLATTVTDLGLWVLVFTFWEGLICAWIQPKFGVIASTITHGLTIFLLSSGLI